MATIRGDRGVNVLRGTDADDAIFGLAGDDVLHGLGGADRLSGGPDEDALRADGGDDVLDGSPGGDLLDGGPGADAASYATFAASVAVDLAAGRAFTRDGMDVLVSVEDAVGTGRDFDSLVGSTAANRLSGLAGDDFLDGRGGADLLLGGSGDDELQGGDGVDRLLGEGGADVLGGGLGSDALDGGADDDELSGGDGTDDLGGGLGADRLAGGDDADRLRGDGGDDGLNGGAANDILTGGLGLDLFVYDALTAPERDDRDLITDFRRGSDQVAVDNFFYVGDELFAALDSDGSGALDRGDAFVGVRTATFDGRRATSTVIDIGGLIAEAEGTSADYRPGTGLLTVFGATGLTADDIVGTF